MDVFYNFLTIDSNQLLSGVFDFDNLIIPFGADCYHKFEVINEVAMPRKPA